MLRLSVLVGSLLCLGAFSAPQAQPTRDAGTLESAVESLIVGLLTADQGVCLGAPIEQAIEHAEAASAANMVGRYILPLKLSQYAVEGGFEGVVQFVIDPEEDEQVDEISVALLCEKYDKEKLAKLAVEVARRQGLVLERDDEDPSLYLNLDERERDLWVAFGDRVIAIDVDSYHD